MSESEELNDIRLLLWGNSSSGTVFSRWAQGFEFSEFEPTALVQYEGGPCAVLAPVQAFLLKKMLADSQGYSFHDLTPDKCKALLIQAICNILVKCKEDKYRIVSVERQSVQMTETLSEDKPEEEAKEEAEPAKKDDGQCSSEDFHKRLSVHLLDKIEEVEKFYADHFTVLSHQFGVLLFLYTVILTKGIENVKRELSDSDSTEPLIHTTYGYGAQGLINLMLTGCAVSHVFDNIEDVGGLRLQGIKEQSDVGFITLMEQLRLCTVGSFYKNPKNPVWVMGNETHLTVLFSDEPRLVSPETPSEGARRVFKSYDPEGNNFIPSDKLQEVLSALDLVSEPEYVEIMRDKLDPEKLGIILLNAFMDEFFPEERRSVPDTFKLWHYNGIPRSNDGHKVKYNCGAAILLESDLRVMLGSNQMLMCLQTKWPNIEVNWNDSRTPSLN